MGFGSGIEVKGFRFREEREMGLVIMCSLSHKKAEGGSARWAKTAAWLKKISDIGFLE
jgi:hypothetical protein